MWLYVRIGDTGAQMNSVDMATSTEVEGFCVPGQLRDDLERPASFRRNADQRASRGSFTQSRFFDALAGTGIQTGGRSSRGAYLHLVMGLSLRNAAGEVKLAKSTVAETVNRILFASLLQRRSTKP